MAHPDVLETLARLTIDPTFRAAFLDDAPAALGPIRLSDPERAALAGLGREAVTRLGLLADFHRLARIREHLPWLDPALRPDLVARVRDYLPKVPPRLLNREEAIAFCLHLEVVAPTAPPYLAELCRLDRLRISVAWGLLASPVIARFEHPLDRILAALPAPGWPDVGRRPVAVEIKKVPMTPAVVLRWS
jgi:hypothetical protein